MAEDRLEVSQRELEMIKEHAKLESRVEQLEDDMPRVLEGINDVKDIINNIPLEIVKCKDSMDRDMKGYIHDRFITDVELNRFEDKLEHRVTTEIGKIAAVVNKAKWTIGAFISAGSLFIYVLVETKVIL